MRSTTTWTGTAAESGDAGHPPFDDDARQEYRPPGEDRLEDTSAPSSQPQRSPSGVKVLVVRPGRLQSIRFPYDHALEKEKERIERLNEELGW